MLTARSTIFRAFRTATRRSSSSEIAIANQKHEQARNEIEASKSQTQRTMEAMTKLDPYMVWGSLTKDPDPVLPDNPAEISALDPAGRRDNIMHDGTQRTVMIRQLVKNVSQSPNQHEATWTISFQSTGETANQWINPLMGWVSGADPYHSIALQMYFNTASEAVYFAKKRGWNYLVSEPVYRMPRNDSAQYQDNFLPQYVVAKLKLDRTRCKHWERPLAGTSHYTRPLKYHGVGEVRQHGPNLHKELDKHMVGYYKIR